MLVFASLLKMGCFLIWMLGSTFLFYALGFAEALASGAIETSLYDSLKLEENHTQFEQVWSGAGNHYPLCRPLLLGCLKHSIFRRFPVGDVFP